MSTINELIYNVRMEIKDFKSDDIKLSDRNIEFLIRFLRAKLIRQDVQKHGYVSENFKQNLDVIELETVDKSELSDFPTGTYVLRSVKDIPNLIDAGTADKSLLITGLYGMDTGNRIDLKPKVQAIKNSWSKYASKRIAAYYSNNKIYVIGCGDNYELEYIKMEGVFENPREVAKFNKKDGTSCYDPDVDRYPISGHLIDMINSLIKRQELDLYFNLALDTQSDGRTNE